MPRRVSEKNATVKTSSAPAVAGYDELLHDLKKRIEQARVRAALAVNRELVVLYWDIGRDILLHQQL